VDADFAPAKTSWPDAMAILATRVQNPDRKFRDLSIATFVHNS